MKIAFVTTYDAKNVTSWSGLPYHLSKYLMKRGIEIEFIGPLKKKTSLFNSTSFLKKKHLGEREIGNLQYYAKQVEEKLSKLDVDYVFSPGTVPISYLDTNTPIIFWTDATFAGMINYYESFTNLDKSSIKAGNIAEQSALDRCKYAIYSSKWAADSAINNYKVDKDKVKIIPLGGNVEHDLNLNDIKKIIKNRDTNVCRILFIGKDWERKGGDKVVQIVTRLNEMGLKTHLDIAGCNPKIDQKLDFITKHGFLNGIQDRKKLDSLFYDSHFFILPTKAECYGLVLSEANSYGIPCLTTMTGGLSDVITDDVNGKLFRINDDADIYCDYILKVFNNHKKYDALALSSFKEYKKRLNWDYAVDKFITLLEKKENEQ